jgi:hypothetical protein
MLIIFTDDNNSELNSADEPNQADEPEDDENPEYQGSFAFAYYLSI